MTHGKGRPMLRHAKSVFRPCILVCAGFFAISSRPGASDAQAAFTEARIEPASRPSVTRLILRDLPIPMRDGVVLRADLWNAPDAGRRPVLIYRTPFGKIPEGEDQKD